MRNDGRGEMGQSMTNVLVNDECTYILCMVKDDCMSFFAFCFLIKRLDEVNRFLGRYVYSRLKLRNYLLIDVKFQL